MIPTGYLQSGSRRCWDSDDRCSRTKKRTKMSTVMNGTAPAASAGGWLSKERTIAGPGYNRWLLPPAALAIHLCIGMAYGFSVFWLPLSRALGLSAPKACPDISLFQELFTTPCDWKVASMGWMYTLFFVLLGVSAALWA